MTERLTKSDYEEVLADHRRLVRELDAIISAPHAPAKQASLCDLIPLVKKLRADRDWLEEALAHAMDMAVPDDECVECKEIARRLGWE